MMRNAIHVLVIISISLILLGPIPEQCDAQQADEPHFILKMDREEAFADVHPGSTGIVTFSGNITCIFPLDAAEYAGYSMHIVGHCEDLAVLWPPKLMFTPSSARRGFSISCYAPVGTSADFIGDLTISAGWVSFDGNESGSIEPVECKVRIRPYPGISLQGITYHSCHVGEWRDYEVFITNEGNSGIDLTLKATPDKDHMVIEPMNTTIFIPEGGEASQVFRVKQKSGPLSGNLIDIYAESEEGEVLDSITLSHHTELDVGRVSRMIGLFLIPVVLIGVIVIVIVVGRRSGREGNN